MGSRSLGHGDTWVRESRAEQQKSQGRGNINSSSMLTTKRPLVCSEQGTVWRTHEKVTLRLVNETVSTLGLQVVSLKGPAWIPTRLKMKRRC